MTWLPSHVKWNFCGTCWESVVEKKIICFSFLCFYLMLMKHFLGSLNSGLGKTVYVEIILKISKLLVQYKIFPKNVKMSQIKNLEHISLVFLHLFCHNGRVSCAWPENIGIHFCLFFCLHLPIVLSNIFHTRWIKQHTSHLWHFSSYG